MRSPSPPAPTGRPARPRPHDDAFVPLTRAPPARRALGAAAATRPRAGRYCTVATAGEELGRAPRLPGWPTGDRLARRFLRLAIPRLPAPAPSGRPAPDLRAAGRPRAGAAGAKRSTSTRSPSRRPPPPRGGRRAARRRPPRPRRTLSPLDTGVDNAAAARSTSAQGSNRARSAAWRARRWPARSAGRASSRTTGACEAGRSRPWPATRPWGAVDAACQAGDRAAKPGAGEIRSVRTWPARSWRAPAHRRTPERGAFARRTRDRAVPARAGSGPPPSPREGGR